LRSDFCFRLYFVQLYLPEVKVFCQIQYRVSCPEWRPIIKEHNFEIWQHFCIQSFAMSLFYDQQHDRSLYFVKLAKNGRWIQDGGSKIRSFSIALEVKNIFTICFCIKLVLVRHKFCGKKVFKKYKMAAKN
jgi:hypothetical protein